MKILVVVASLFLSVSAFASAEDWQVANCHESYGSLVVVDIEGNMTASLIYTGGAKPMTEGMDCKRVPNTTSIKCESENYKALIFTNNDNQRIAQVDLKGNFEPDDNGSVFSFGCPQ